MLKFNKEQLGRRFYGDGARCIKDAELLYRQRNGHQSSYSILLVHGIELLLKSYILLKDTRELNQVKKSFLTHDYNKLYLKCLGFGDELKNEDLKTLIELLSTYHRSDSIKARYVEETGIVQFYTNTFIILENRLVAPIQELINLLRIKKPLIKSNKQQVFGIPGKMGS